VAREGTELKEKKGQLGWGAKAVDLLKIESRGKKKHQINKNSWVAKPLNARRKKPPVDRVA